LLRKNKGAAWMFVNIMDASGAQAVDDHTVVFKLKTPFAPLPLVMPWLFVANEQLVKQHDVGGDEGEKWLLDHEAGSGPFTIKSWQIGDSYTFDAVKDYWAGWSAQGHVSGFVWKILRESTSQRLALLKGDVQIAFELAADDIAALAKEPGITVDNQPSIGVFAVKLNNQKGPTADINVRKAISYAMDYDAIIKAVNGRAVLLQGPLPSNLGDYADPALKPYRFDMAKAEAALKQSPQYANGGFELEYVYVTGLQLEEQIGLILLDKLSQFDITVKMQPLVWPDMVARAKSSDTAPAMMAVYSGTDYADPDNFLWQAYHSSQAGFWAAASHYKNPAFDTLLEEARSSADHPKRVELYRSAQEMLINDAVEVWGHSEFPTVAFSKKLGGYDGSPIMGKYLRPFWLQG
jgi:peptide/nickel transport system substrate-binding protein